MPSPAPAPRKHLSQKAAAGEQAREDRALTDVAIAGCRADGVTQISDDDRECMVLALTYAYQRNQDLAAEINREICQLQQAARPGDAGKISTYTSLASKFLRQAKQAASLAAAIGSAGGIQLTSHAGGGR